MTRMRPCHCQCHSGPFGNVEAVNQSDSPVARRRIPSESVQVSDGPLAAFAVPTSGICTACQIIHASRSAFGEVGLAAAVPADMPHAYRQNPKKTGPSHQLLTENMIRPIVQGPVTSGSATLSEAVVVRPTMFCQ